MTGRIPARRARVRLGALSLAALAGGCAATAVPPRPTLPEVRYVEPCDQSAVIALSPEAQAALVQRDSLMREHISHLEALLRGE